MPNADVLVEATFVKEEIKAVNPNTGQFTSVIIILLISFISTTLFIILKRRNKVV